MELDSGMENVYGVPMNCGALSFPSTMVILIVVVAIRAGVPGVGVAFNEYSQNLTKKLIEIWSALNT